MGCLLAFFGVFFPRVVVFLIWLARPVLFEAAIPSALVAILGILFLPFTTLMYVVLWSPAGFSGADFVWLALAFGIDVLGYVGSGYGNRDRIPGYGSSDPAP